MKQSKILIVDDNQSVLSALELLLGGKCKVLKMLPSPNLLLNELAAENYDILLLDMNFSAGINSGNEGIYWLQRVLEIKPEMGVIMITAYGDIELAVKAVRMGAMDFILKPWENDKLIETVEATIRLCASRKSVKKSATVDSTDIKKTIIGSSLEWLKVMEVAEKVASTDANILITGENGTGKELIAEVIHDLSGRKDKKMITVDMGAVSETLFESELFGHKKGAYTDANADRTGKIEEASGGTLFLDEIGNMPMAMQAKLLTVLQNRSVTRVGENVAIPVDVRLICATNGNLMQMVERGHFRDDLLYRINTIQIELPPLRNRKTDIPELAYFFLKKYVEKYHKSELSLSESALAKLENYNWPGNVRELQHSIEKAVILCDSLIIQPSDFTFRVDEITVSGGYSGTLEDMERKLIADAIAKSGGNLSIVASNLGVTRQTLYNKIKKYGL